MSYDGKFFRPVWLGAALLVGASAAHASLYTIDVAETGTDVVATGSGSVDLTGLSLFGSGSINGGYIYPAFQEIGIGGAADTSGYLGLTRLTTPFAAGAYVTASSNTGESVQVQGNGALLLPQDYASDSSLGTSTSTFDNATLASLGLTVGIYTWTRSNGSIVLDIEAPATVPEPGTIALLALPVAALAIRRRARS